MRILFDHSLPFSLAHGGEQVQIEKTRSALIEAGVLVEYMRWWDDAQAGDIIHYFGRPSESYVNCAHQKNVRIVVSELLGVTANRSLWKKRLQKIIVALARGSLSNFFTHRMSWEVYRQADAFIALTEAEAYVMREVFGAPADKINIIPNGVEDFFFCQSEDAARNQWLVCTAAIIPRKRVLELAQAASQAKVPVWIIGKPFSLSDNYYQTFLKIAEKNPNYVRYEGAIDSREKLADVYKSSKGFVLLSSGESLSLSVLEAAAARCPLLLSDLPWATKVFKDAATYCPVTAKTEITGRVLADFYEKASEKRCGGYKPLRWEEVANALCKLYETVLANAQVHTEC